MKIKRIQEAAPATELPKARAPESKKKTSAKDVQIDFELLPEPHKSSRPPIPVQPTPVPESGLNASGLRKSSGAKAPPPPQIDAWSFSRWETYEGCPLKAKYKFVDHLPEPDNPATARGSRMHESAQAYLERRVQTLDPALSQFPEEFTELRSRAPHCEEQWAFTRSWEATGWFAKGANAAWCRVKMDAFAFDERSGVLRIVDFKSGKERPSHEIQLELYGLAGFLRFPQAREVVAADWYLDLGFSKERTFAADQRHHLLALWNDRVAPMCSDRRFCANPTRACSWCHFRKDNGGPCKW